MEQGSDIEEELLRSGSPPAVQHSAAQAHAGSAGANGGPRSRSGYTPHQAADTGGARPVSRILKDPTVGRVLSALGYEPADTDQLCQRSGLDFSRVAAVLTELELNDIVYRLSDGQFQRRQQELL